MSSVRGVVGVECANTKEFGYIDDPGREREEGRIYRRRNLEEYVATHEVQGQVLVVLRGEV